MVASRKEGEKVCPGCVGYMPYPYEDAEYCSKHKADLWLWNITTFNSRIRPEELSNLSKAIDECIKVRGNA